MTPRVAFIGAGQMARHHAEAVRRLSVPSTVMGVYDPATRQAEAFAAANGTRAFPSLDAMLGSRPDIVHVCTPPAYHFQSAHAALDAGAHVYVEKPFALTVNDARTLLTLAHSRGRLVCAGHQLLHDPGFQILLGRLGELGTLLHADSHFTFRPVGASSRTSADVLAQHLIDILPHPLYSLISVMERAISDSDTVHLAWADATPTSVHAILRAGNPPPPQASLGAEAPRAKAAARPAEGRLACEGGMTGRLFVSLRARPIASSLTLTGTDGSLSCDFMRSIVVGSPNPGTELLEKVFTPIVEGGQLISRTTASTARRLRSGIGYPGLSELLGSFYEAVARGHASPLTSRHLIRVSEVFEALVARIDATVARSATGRSLVPVAARKPRIVVTGARGFLGAELARALGPVRGIGRGARPEDANISEWVTADLSRGLSPEALSGADIVVHAAAETSGGYDDHRRNTIAATRHLLHAMNAAGVRKLLLVSSLSVLEPPRSLWERQNEQTKRPSRPRAFGPYTWGKCLQEALVEREAPKLGIAVRIVRPGALTDSSELSLPGLMGRRLFGRWHLGLGRPALPIAVCDVGRCADAIAWCVRNFDEAPHTVHLFDPELTTRGTFLAHIAERGWNGRMVWVPISAIAFGLSTVRTLLSLRHLRWPTKLAAWSILRPRRYDPTLTSSVMERSGEFANAERKAG
ncbi:MAG TPA: Gfo/Idh/MocA family oxidoreductase [Vicinamibacterales bacterium]|nr:Gfo/Idh/MocA family oxidoreductase [Vicinamibacterales bacterium]